MDISDLRKVGRRLIRISANQAFGMELLPHLIARHQEEDPTVTFRLTLQRAAEIYRRVQDGEDDLGLYYSLTPAVGVDLQLSRRMRILALMRADHPLANRDVVSLTDIAPYPVGQMSEGTTLRTIIDLCCMHASVELTTVFTSNNVTALQHFCAERDSAVVFFGELTASAVNRRGKLVVLPISNADLHQRHLQIITMQGRELPVSVKRFLNRAIERIELSATHC